MTAKRKQATGRSQLIIELDHEEHRRIKLEALLTGKTMSDIVRERVVIPLMAKPMKLDWADRIVRRDNQ